MSEKLTLDEVEDIARRALMRSGAAALQAGPVAHSIREAEAEGTRGIGLGYLPYYCRHLEVGKIDGEAVPALTRPRPAALAVDAHAGFAHPAFRAGEAGLIETAREQGLAALGIRNAYACGVVGYFVDRLARQGLVALATTNASASMAPWGGRKPFFGTNPYAFAAPREGAAPLVIDSSSTATAKINIINAAAEGRALPPGWALDAEGRPTTDAQAALAGSVAPAGGHKGAALALMVEVLSVGLTGSHWSHLASSLGDDEGGPPRLGQFFLAVDPGLFGAPGFGERLEAMLAAMTEEEGVRLPGARRHANRARAEAEGVIVEAPFLQELRRLAGE
ncbi:MAG TPA: Ldh family oxidoreductase [Paracoccaceae bacterium]|nr:Ldh family oxidoreductase [Paracoccaceae bacterium]